MTHLSGKKIAIIADWLTSRGGAERVVFAMAEAFPQAVIFTSVFDEERFPEFQNREVRTSFLQKLPHKVRRRHQFLLPLFPKAFESFDLSEFDVIISSSSSGFSKCVRKTRPGQIHICYCHTPVRFLYHARDEYVNDYPVPWWLKPFKMSLPALLDWLKKKDLAAAKKVDFWIANSDFVGKRIQEFYGKKSVTIYPGINTQFFTPHDPEKGNYFLSVGRFIPYKKFDLLVETFARNKLPLKLAGIGPELEKCQELAKNLNAKNIEFLGFFPDRKLAELYGSARAFLFPAEEDFGLAPVEAMAAGVPVIYFDAGGARESVREWGIPFAEQTRESVQKGIDEFLTREKEFDRQKIVSHAQEFDESVFKKNLKEFVEKI